MAVVMVVVVVVVALLAPRVTSGQFEGNNRSNIM